MEQPSLTDALRETLALFDGNATPRTTSEVADQLNLGQRSTYTRLKRLVEHDELETKKVGASARVWWRPPTNADQDIPDWPAAESLVDDVLDDADVGVFVLDEDFQVAWVNDATKRYFGLDYERVVGKDKRTLVNEYIASTITESNLFAETVLATYDDNTYTEQFECHVEPGDGHKERWLEHRSKPIEAGAYAGGRIELYYDVTNQKQTEQSLEESKQRYSSLVSNLPGMVYRCRNETEWPMEFVSDACTDLTGYDADAIESGTISWSDDIVHPDDRTQILETVQSGLDRNGQFTTQYRILTAHDEIRWVWERGRSVTDTSGSSTLEGVITDITGQKITEQELQEKELENVYERMDDGFVALDEDHRFTYVNNRAGALLERCPSELVGEHIWDAFERSSTVKAAITDVFENQEPKSQEIFYDPLETWFEAHIYPAETGISVYFQDITGRKERQTEVKQYERIVEAVDDGIYVLDSDYRFSMVSNGLTSMTGYERDELIGVHAQAIFGYDFFDIEEAKLAESESSDSSFAKLEDEIHTASGSTLTVESRFSRFELEDGEIGRVGVIRDVTDRVKHERQLEKLKRRYQKLVDNFPNGAVVLFDEDLRYLTVGGEVFEGLDVSADDLEGERVPKSLPAELRRDIEPRYSAVFDGETSDIEVDFGGRIRRIQAFPIYDEQGTVFAGMAMSQDITDRIERERRLKRQREHLSALNHFNDVFHDIIEAVIEQSTREEIETIVCDRLTDTDNYRVAWIGEVDNYTQTVNVRTGTGVEGYLDDITISVDPNDERSNGPTSRAILEREVQTTQDISTDSSYESWRDFGQKYGFRSSAAVPIVHEETLYGILTLYSDQPDAFTGKKCEIIGQLGEITGQAIAAVERKQALMSNEVVELEFQLTNVFETLGIDETTDGRITLNQSVPASGGMHLVYGTVTTDARDALGALITQLPQWNSMTVIDEGEDVSRFELRLSEPPVLSTVAAQGGSVDTARIEDGDYHMRIHLAPSVEVREIIETVQAEYPGMELLAQRQVTRTGDPIAQLDQFLEEDLTDQQRTSLNAAYNSGFFEWPRPTTGEDIADSLGISSPTFHQHLRTAERKVFDAVIEGSIMTS
ncbi:putative PAS/PAC sensor protein [Haladaptatus paucihalophilus DX253]|uniref:histidine kinase n=1 Tax=Haladaptatus paucihalophilus DX253 TaxID=797209 RepID=E7QVT5_HALPU|nr:PAS domain S-box protein [Haladaptatus paucihalophilus]EFW91348.1 putative PAS/PAC sensor protein [Haladaptatus paucihalophilus DX253]SHL11520.1 PAS domain S-box-containing protein [Haladaptatus paucihalophilus DX253]